MCVARFEPHTRDAFIDLYTKIDSNSQEAPEAAAVTDIEVPF